MRVHVTVSAPRQHGDRGVRDRGMVAARSQRRAGSESRERERGREREREGEHPSQQNHHTASATHLCVVLVVVVPAPSPTRVRDPGELGDNVVAPERFVLGAAKGSSTDLALALASAMGVLVSSARAISSPPKLVVGVGNRMMLGITE